MILCENRVDLEIWPSRSSSRSSKFVPLEAQGYFTLSTINHFYNLFLKISKYMCFHFSVELWWIRGCHGNGMISHINCWDLYFAIRIIKAKEVPRQKMSFARPYHWKSDFWQIQAPARAPERSFYPLIERQTIPLKKRHLALFLIDD